MPFKMQMVLRDNNVLYSMRLKIVNNGIFIDHEWIINTQDLSHHVKEHILINQ